MLLYIADDSSGDKSDEVPFETLSVFAQLRSIEIELYKVSNVLLNSAKPHVIFHVWYILPKVSVPLSAVSMA